MFDSLQAFPSRLKLTRVGCRVAIRIDVKADQVMSCVREFKLHLEELSDAIEHYDYGFSEQRE